MTEVGSLMPVCRCIYASKLSFLDSRAVRQQHYTAGMEFVASGGFVDVGGA